jgi:tRNA A37 threonylcarbamoyladenosine biosynthesis protein TsaE
LSELYYYDYYTLLSLKEIFDTRCSDRTSGNAIVIIEFLRMLINCKSYKLYKPV